MLEFKIDSENPRLLHTAIAYDFFFELLDVAIAAEKSDIELVNEMEKVLELSFVMANMFMSKVQQEQKIDDNV